MTAESARIEIRPHAVVFIMQNGVRQERQQKKEAMHVLSFKRYPVDISLYASGLANREKQPEERFLQELWLPEATVSDLLRARLLPEFWQRLFWPCYSLVLPMRMALWLLHRPHRRVGYWSWDLWVWMAVLWAVYGAALLLPSLSLRMPQIRFLIPIFPLVIILSGILAWRPPRIPGWSRKWAKQ
jgi:lipopolysaccharide export LptBFGC system permease protein LptF